VRTIKFIDLFAGIGGFREGLERNGFECAGWVEVDKFKQQAYKAVHDTEGEWHKDDITTIRAEELPKADIYTGGFPCQSFSIAGNRGGFEDTRGTLFFEIARLAKERKPKYLLLENVGGLLSHDGGKTFGTILQTLWDIGYDCQWQVLNSKDFGVPQNRKRVFIIGHLRGQSRPKVFPIRKVAKEVEIGVIGTTQNPEAEGTNDYKQPKQIMQVGNIVDDSDINFKNPQRGRIYNSEGICPTLNTVSGGGLQPKIVVRACLTPSRINKRQNGRRFKKDREPSFTLTKQDIHGVAIKEATKKGYDIANYGDSVNYQFPNSKTRRGRVGKGVANTLETQNNQGVVTESYKIRKLTPLETFRLQGFPDEWYHKCRAAGISDTQMYRAAGDAVTVNVVQEIGRRLKTGGLNESEEKVGMEAGNAKGS
jgi:DNA (cytosine-5)-methyltransferase 1